MSNHMKTRRRPSSPNLVDAEVARRLELEAYQAQVAELAEKLGRALARGTDQGMAPLVLPLPDRIYSYLEEHATELKVLAKALGADPEEVEGALHALSKAGRIANVGLPSSPRWTAVVGDGISTPALNSLVLRLIAVTPMTVKELQVATGARLGRVGGAIVAAQRTSAVIDVEPTQRAGRYYVVPADARDARLNAKVESPDEVEGD